MQFHKIPRQKRLRIVKTILKNKEQSIGHYQVPKLTVKVLQLCQCSIGTRKTKETNGRGPRPTYIPRFSEERTVLSMSSTEVVGHPYGFFKKRILTCNTSKTKVNSGRIIDL